MTSIVQFLLTRKFCLIAYISFDYPMMPMIAPFSWFIFFTNIIFYYNIMFFVAQIWFKKWCLISLDIRLLWLSWSTCSLCWWCWWPTAWWDRGCGAVRSLEKHQTTTRTRCRRNGRSTMIVFKHITLLMIFIPVTLHSHLTNLLKYTGWVT